MKINPVGMTGISQYREVSRKSEIVTKTTQGRDKLSLSDNAVSFSAALKAAKDVPEVRENMVTDLRERVNNGTYTVDSRAVAERMMNVFNVMR